jgi:tetratricopeptide (TPR) repeat protein
MNVRVPFLAAIVAAAAIAGCSRETAPAAPANQTAHDAHGAAAPARSAPRTALLGNLGSYHRAIKTANADAQKFFDEGLTLLYGFNHEESFKSFELAASKDPASPMPHWGMSLALGTNINDIAPADRLKLAYTHLAEAQKRKTGGSDVEQGMVDALAKRYVADPTGDQAVREQAYSDAMGTLAKRFPDDLDLATLYAESLMNLRPWRLYTKDGTPEPGTEQIVASLERVMRRDPSHPGANHYYIHAVEASTSPERALPQAGRLETLVPGAGHLVHMPAHIYIRTGQYAKSAQSNAIAAGVDEKYIAATGANGLYPMMYYTHNVQFQSAAAMYAGSLAEARSAAQRTVKIADPIADQMVMIEPFAAQELAVLVRFGQWPAILEVKPPAPTRLVQSAMYHFAHGAALAATGKVAEAEADLTALKAAASRIAKDAMVGASNSAPDVVAVAIADLTARIADARGDTAAAIKGFTAAIAL